MFNVYINHFNRNGVTVNKEELMFSVPGDNGFPVNSPSVQCSEDAAENFSFVLEPSSPYYDAILPLKTLFRVEYDGTIIFYGRAQPPSTSTVFNTKNVTCEGWYAFLNDTYYEGVQEKFRSKITVSQYLDKILANHNNAAPNKEIKRGNVAASLLPSETDKYEPSSWTQSVSLISNLTSNYGGHIRVRYVGNDKYLDWYKYYAHDGGEGVRPHVQVGKNILDISSDTDVDSIFTRLIPIGDTKTNGKTIYIQGYNGYANKYMSVSYLQKSHLYTDDELTDEFHNWKDYRDAEDTYGIIYKTMQFSDADNQAKLWNYAKKWIKSSYFGVADSFTVKAIDFHITGEEGNAIPKILVGECVDVEFQIIQNGEKKWVTKKLVCKSAKYDLFNPENNSYVFGVPSDLLEHNKHNKKSSGAKTASAAAAPKSIGGGGGGEDTELTWYRVYELIGSRDGNEYEGTGPATSYYSYGELSGVISAYDKDEYTAALGYYQADPDNPDWGRHDLGSSPSPESLGVAFKANLIGKYTSNGTTKYVALSSEKGLFAYTYSRRPYPGNVVAHWYIKKKGYTYEANEANMSTFEKVALMIEKDSDASWGGATNAAVFRKAGEIHATTRCYDPNAEPDTPQPDYQRVIFNANIIGRVNATFGSMFVCVSGEYGIFGIHKSGSEPYPVSHWYQKAAGVSYDTKTNLISDSSGGGYFTGDGMPAPIDDKGQEDNTKKLIMLNTPITYKDKNGVEHTVQGGVTAADFEVEDIPSFRTQLGIFDNVLALKVNANEIEAQIAYITRLQTGKVFSDDYVTTPKLTASEVEATNFYTYAEGERSSLTAAYSSVVISAGTGADNGKIIFDFGRVNGGRDTKNFNIADTKFYKDEVSAARTAGINSVYISKGNWSNGSIDIYKKVGSTFYSGTQHINLSMLYSWDSTDKTKCIVKAYDDIDEETSNYTGKQLEINVGSKLQSQKFTSNGVKKPGTGYFGFSSVEIAVPSGTISLSNSDIWTSDRATGTILTKLKSSYETAKEDSDFVMFTMKCSCGASKTYYMQP